MQTLIPAKDNKIMPWKNGLGSTAEIEIFPPGANFAENTFDYRLSSARVGAPGPFSRFPGYDRILCIIEGEALRINGYRHQAYEPFRFSGEEEIYAALYGSAIIDLGLIYRRDLYEAKMQILNMPADETTISLEKGTHLFFCAEGHLTVNSEHLNKADTLKIQDEERVRIKQADGARGIWISLKRS